MMSRVSLHNLTLVCSMLAILLLPFPSDLPQPVHSATERQALHFSLEHPTTAIATALVSVNKFEVYHLM